MNIPRELASGLSEKALRFLPVVLAGMAIGAAACGGIDSSSSKQGDSSNDAGLAYDAGSFPLGAYSGCQWLLTGGTFESASAPATLTLAPICDASGCASSYIVASFQSGQTTTTFTCIANAAGPVAVTVALPVWSARNGTFNTAKNCPAGCSWGVS